MPSHKQVKTRRWIITLVFIQKVTLITRLITRLFFWKKGKTSCLLDGYTVALACPHDLLSKREKGHLLQFYTENPEFQMHQGTSVVELLLYQLALVLQIERKFRTKIDCMPSWREVSLQRMRCTVYLWLPRDQPWLETPWMKTATHRN